MDDLEKRFHIKYEVVAYDESWGGYGDNASRDFTNKEDAIEYVKSLKEKILKYPGGPQYGPLTVWKRISMDPIAIEVKY